MYNTKHQALHNPWQQYSTRTSLQQHQQRTWAGKQQQYPSVSRRWATRGPECQGKNVSPQERKGLGGSLAVIATNEMGEWTERFSYKFKAAGSPTKHLKPCFRWTVYFRWWLWKSLTHSRRVRFLWSAFFRGKPVEADVKIGSGPCC
jgi:hypothetical protein